MMPERLQEIKEILEAHGGLIAPIANELLAEIDKLRAENKRVITHEQNARQFLLETRLERDKLIDKLAVAEKKYEKLETVILWSDSNDWTPPSVDGWKKIIATVHVERWKKTIRSEK